METEVLSILQGRRKTAWIQLLESTGLEPDGDFDSTVLIWDNDALVAAGSRKGQLLKCIAVDSSYQGQGLTGTLLTQLRQDAFLAGYRHLFLYTKPENRYLFSSLFFHPIAQTDKVLLMENQAQGIASFLATLSTPCLQGTVGAAVMNCNPFTKGHRYLIETAASECDWVYLFVLSEDKSFFSTQDRIAMVQSGTADLKNVTILPTGPYLISSATFPTYFLKDRDSAPQVHCRLDIEIFCRHFVPHFGITRRYVGTEPLSAMTDAYNDALARELPGRNIELRLLPRLETQGLPISASAVRKHLENHNLTALHALLPKTTIDYLQTRGLL